MSATSPSRAFLFSLAVLLLVPAATFAQSTGGTIAGTIVDESGAVIPGVTVTATNVQTGAARTSISNDVGAYSFPLLTPGTYDVTAELSGFSPAKRSAIVVNIGSDITLKLMMRIGVSESVTVTAEAPLLETTRSQVSSVVNEKSVENLPVNGRNFIDFALTTPGVVKDTRLGDISFAGQRGTLNSLVVDGADNNNTFFGQALGRTGSGRAPYQFSQDAVKEFQVNSNAYSAEYGRAGGAVINVITKSGTNDFHGASFFFLRDKDYNANDYINELNNRPKGPYHYDQYGLSVGGPIVQDKHFFFFNYDAQRNTQPNLVVMNIPSGTPTDDVTLAGIARLRTLAGSYDRTQDQDVYLLKTDHELFKSSHLSLRYNRQNFTGGNFENGGLTNALEHTGDSLVQTDTVTGSFTTPVSSSFFNEVRGQYARDHEPGRANSDNPEATIRQNGQTVLTIGRNFFSPRETTIHRDQVADTATYLWKEHTFKAGFDVNRDQILNYFPGNFSGSYTFNSIADFMGGRPNGAGERYVQAFAGPGTTGPTTHPDLFETALFAQDEWHLNPALTINAGLRYDKQGIKQPDVQNPDAQLLAAGLDTSHIPEDNNNIGVRLGFAYNPSFSPRTVIRGGYGTFYGRTTAIMIGTAMSNNGINVQTITFTGDSVPTYPNIFPSIPEGAVASKPTIFVFDPNFQNPMVHQASLGVEHGLSNDLSVGMIYQFVQGEDLPRSIDINIGTPSIVTIPLAEGGTVDVKKYGSDRPFSNFSRVIEFQSSARSRYNGVTFDVNKRFSKNWQASAAYTWSKAMDNKPDATAVVPFSSGDDSKYAQDPHNLNGDWAPSDVDVRHRVVLSGVWNLDYAQNLNGFVHALAEGWSVSGIASYQSGQPYTATVNADLNGDGNSFNDRAPGFARNSFRMPGQFSLDPRVTRDIRIAGGLHMELIAEAFNLLNRHNVNGVRTVYYSYANGKLTRTTNFGTPTSSAGPRIVQLAAKLTF